MTIAQRVYVTTILLFKVNHVPKLLLQSFTYTPNVRVQIHIMYDEDIKRVSSESTNHELAQLFQGSIHDHPYNRQQETGELNFGI